MDPNKPLRWPPTADDCIGIAIAFTVSFLLIYTLPAERLQTVEVPQQPVELIAEPTVTGPGLPSRIRIPGISVNAALEHVGLTAEGEAGVPQDPANAAWLDAGPRPGEIGTAVIDGHYGWSNDVRAVFDDLHLVQIGDSIYVDDETGASIQFIVREIRTYGESDETSDVFFATDGGAHLNLITCEGAWSAARGSYSDRLVVFTDRAA